jgi:hypothetical protein
MHGAKIKKISSDFRKKLSPFVNSSFRPDVENVCALLVYYSASNANSFTRFRDRLSIPSLRVKNPKNYQYSLHSSPQGGCSSSPFPSSRGVTPSEIGLYLPDHHNTLQSDTVYYKKYLRRLQFCKPCFWVASDVTTLRFLRRSKEVIKT